MSKTNLVIPFLFLTVWMACSLSKSNKTAQPPPVKKFYTQPVNLTVSGIERDTSLLHLFEEAFAKHGVKLIDREEMKLRNETEVRRVGEIVFTRDAKYTDGQDILKAMGMEHKYVSNMLSVRLVIQDKNDSLMIYKASFTNIPFPPNFSRPIAPAKREINLSNLSYSVRENIFSIVDSILYSKELY
jgi:hypothetical protein